MRFALRFALFGACIILAACATDPKTIAITPQSPKALIVVQVEPSPIEAGLLLALYDAQTGTLDATLSTGMPLSTSLVPPTALTP